KTLSSLGARMLKRWLALPLKNTQKIKQRHQAVNAFLKDKNLKETLQKHIKQVGDLERLVSKIATQKINPREVVQLKNSLDAVIPIKEALQKSEVEYLKVISDNIQSCNLLREKIGKTIQEEAPVNILKGNVVLKGFSK